MEKAAEDADAFSYAGKTWQITVSGKKKTDTIRETKYEYDGKNQLTAYTDPEGRRETYTYDENSNLTKTVDKNKNVIKNTYDHQNRLTEMVLKEKKTGKETTHTCTYNAYGETASQDGTAYLYDDADGQLTKETTKLTKYKTVEKNYTYDSAGNKTAFAVTVGNDTKLSLQYDYDGESKVTAVKDEKGNQVVVYAYDTDGSLAERTVPGNHMTNTYTYDYQNHLTAMENRTESSGVISRYSSEYLANGQKAKETSDVTGRDGKKSTKTAAYTYDLLGRIIKETRTGSKDITYTYDSNNNRKTMTAGNKVTAYKYNKNDELLRTDTLNTDTEKDTVVIYKNDRNGNQLATVNRYEIPEEKKGKPYIDIDVTLGSNRLNKNVVSHYNAENQLVRTLTKNYKVSFTYDAEGLRTSKTVNGEKTVYVWDGDQLVLELKADGKVKKRYVRGNDLVFADKGNGTKRQYYVTDPHGNVVQLTDGEGKVIKTYEYDSFGNEVKPEEKDDNPFRYCGQYYDKETGEVYLRARYYQPAKGRFLTRDTYTGEEDEPESLHLYAYCGNDGVNQVDPSGHDAIWLQYKDGANGFGHTGLAVQGNKNQWFYFYWGAKNGGLGQIRGEAKKICVPVQITTGYYRWPHALLNDIKSKVYTYYEEELTGLVYIKGNFKKSHKKIEKLGGKYNLISNNCYIVSMRMLLKGKFKKESKTTKKILKEVKRQNYTIPNTGFNYFMYLIQQKGNKKQKLWCISE